MSISTPLHVAVSSNAPSELTRYLVEGGSDLGYTNFEGRTPLHTFFNDTQSWLLANYADEINTKAADLQGSTFAHFLARSKMSQPEDLRQIVRHHPSCLKDADAYGRTVLHLAAERGNIPMTSYLLEEMDQADLTRKDASGASALHYAVRSVRTTTISLILSKCQDLFVMDGQRQTILHHAATLNNAKRFEAILQLEGSEMLAWQDAEGYTPVDLAMLSNATLVINFLERELSVLPRKWKAHELTKSGYEHLQYQSKASTALFHGSAWRRALFCSAVISLYLFVSFISSWTQQAITCLVIGFALGTMICANWIKR